MLRIAQILAGLAFIFISSRLINSLDGPFKLISATLFAVILGYYFVLTNIYILKKSTLLSKTFDGRLEPHKSGHAVLLLASGIFGYGYSGKHSVIIWVSMGGIFFANYLLTMVRSPSAEILKRLDKEDQSRKTKDIEITVSPSTTSESHYLVTVRNKSAMDFRNIRVFYEPLILYADNFGIDTTHMPAEEAEIHDEPIVIESLKKHETIKFERKGWGSHETYDGLKRPILNIGLLVNGESPDRKDRKWCLAKMDLPNARKK